MIFSVFQKNWVFGYSWSTLLWYRCYYPHRSRDALSPVCGIFSVREAILRKNPWFWTLSKSGLDPNHHVRALTWWRRQSAGPRWPPSSSWLCPGLAQQQGWRQEGGRHLSSYASGRQYEEYAAKLMSIIHRCCFYSYIIQVCTSKKAWQEFHWRKTIPIANYHVVFDHSLLLGQQYDIEWVYVISLLCVLLATCLFTRIEGLAWSKEGFLTAQ